MKRTTKIIMLIFICIMILMLEYKIFLLMIYKKSHDISKRFKEQVKISDIENTAIYKNNNVDKKIYISKTGNNFAFKTNLEKFGYINKENYIDNIYFLNGDDKTIISINNSTNLKYICKKLAEYKNVNEELIVENVYNNALKFYKIPD